MVIMTIYENTVMTVMPCLLSVTCVYRIPVYCWIVVIRC